MKHSIEDDLPPELCHHPRNFDMCIECLVEEGFFGEWDNDQGDGHTMFTILEFESEGDHDVDDRIILYGASHTVTVTFDVERLTFSSRRVDVCAGPMTMPG